VPPAPDKQQVEQPTVTGLEAGARAVEIPAPWSGRSWASSPLAPKGDIRVPVSLGKDALLTNVIQAVLTR
jgi:hypothetical protein